MPFTVEQAIERLKALVGKGWGEIKYTVKDGKITVISKTETEISQ